MKIVISILLSIFILTSQVFADDGVKDPVGMMDCYANKSVNIYENPENKKSFRKVDCKDIIRWANTVDLKSNPDLHLRPFVYEAKEINKKWWYKVKLAKENNVAWVEEEGDSNSARSLTKYEFYHEETEMSEKWDGKIYPKPEFKNSKSAPILTNAIIKEVRTVGGKIWMYVEIIASECAPAEDRPTLARGWIPFMHSPTESNIRSQIDCTP